MDKLAKQYVDVAIECVKKGLYLDEFARDKRALFVRPSSNITHNTAKPYSRKA